MNTERLSKISHHLRYHVKDERFNLATWAGNDTIEWGGLPDLSCGTTACAMGWATTIPEFRELGLILTRKPNGWGGFYPPTIEFDGESHFNAAARFCDISVKEAEYLFNPDSYDEEENASRLEVANRIDDFIQNGAPYPYGPYDQEDDDDEDEE